MSETDYSKSWYQNLFAGMLKLKAAHEEEKKIVVHYDFGNNRSRTFIEAFYYLLTGEPSGVAFMDSVHVEDFKALLVTKEEGPGVPCGG